MVNNKVMNSNQKTLILVSFFITILISSIFTFSLSVFVMQVVLASITIPLLFRKDYKSTKLYLLILIISLLFVFLVYYGNQLYYGEPYYIGGSDDLAFERWGNDIYKSSVILPHKVMEQRIIGRYHNSPFYAVFIALLIEFSSFLDGYSTFLPRIMNVYFLIWVCMILEYLFNKYTNLSRKVILYSLGVFALMPNTQYINSHIFRDVFNLLQVLLIVLLFERIIGNKNFLSKFLDIIFLGTIIYITYYTRVNSLAFAIILMLLIFSERFKIKKIYIILFLILTLFLTDILKTLRVERFIKSYSRYVTNISGDGLSRFVFNKPLLPIGIIFRATYAFITPFPNFLSLFKDSSKILFDFVQLLIYLGVIVQILLIPFIIKRIFKFDWLSFAFLGLFITIIASTFTFRHVIFYYPFMAVLAVDGYSNTSLNSKKQILFLTTISMICFGMIYIVLKIF